MTIFFIDFMAIRTVYVWRLIMVYYNILFSCAIEHHEETSQCSVVWKNNIIYDRYLSHMIIIYSIKSYSKLYGENSIQAHLCVV